MPSDRDTLLGMGFDPARVDCELFHTTSRIHALIGSNEQGR